MNYMYILRIFSWLLVHCCRPPLPSSLPTASLGLLLVAAAACQLASWLQKNTEGLLRMMIGCDVSGPHTLKICGTIQYRHTQ